MRGSNGDGAALLLDQRDLVGAAHTVGATIASWVSVKFIINGLVRSDFTFAIV